MTKWVYKSTAKKMFKLTDNQISQAVAQGLLTARKVPNPNYRSGPPAMLLKLDDLQKNLERVKALPKYGEAEKAKRKLYAKRKRVRDKLEFYCPRCQKRVRALRGSAMFEACFRGDASPEEARKVLMIAHYRHAHTDYDDILASRNAERYERYQELRDEGYDFDMAWFIVDDEFSHLPKEEEDLKKRCNAEAIELLKKDFPGLF